MGKINTPIESKFFKKVFFALIILLSMILITYFSLINIGFDSDNSLNKAVKIVTHVEIVSEEIGFKYFFVVLGIMGEVVQFYLIYVILEYLLEGKFKNIFSGVKHMNKAKNLTNHYIIAGGGRVGSHAAKVLKKYTDKIVIIDSNEELVEKCRNTGLIAVKGDCLDEDFLKSLNISKAKYIIACLDNDGDNILLALTAKELNPGIKINSRANDDSIIPKLKHAGASHVVVPSSIGGEELAKSAIHRS